MKDILTHVISFKLWQITIIYLGTCIFYNLLEKSFSFDQKIHNIIYSVLMTPWVLVALNFVVAAFNGT
jgi:hypothetical protein